MAHLLTRSYLKVTADKIPPSFYHPALVRSPGGDGLGLFFFFSGAQERREREQEAKEAARALVAHAQRRAVGSVWEPNTLAPRAIWITSATGEVRDIGIE